MYGLALRGTFIVDPNGLIRCSQVYDDGVGRSADEVIRVIKALQFFESNGRVCPFNWKGNTAQTIIPTQEGKGE